MGATVSAELMQTADLLPFVRHNIALLHADLRVSAEKILMNPARGLGRREREERMPKTLAWLWRGRALSGFYSAHYPDGCLFDYHGGVQAMVEGVEVVQEGFTRERVVKACVQHPGAVGLYHMILSEPLAMALVWRKYNLPEDAA